MIYNHYFKNDMMNTTIVSGDFLPDAKDASKMTEDELKNYAQAAIDDSQFNMRIVSTATFDKETMSGNLAIQNPPNNSQPVNVIIRIDGSNLEVYDSGAIQPGEEITKATLNKKIDAGTYEATATFNIYNPDTKKKQGSVQAKLTLVVE
ncbi:MULTISPECIES: hypothetical protein [unclassified Enterococcus]|uniref:hypothetical protein n=1 Tax=unclassified Enterococcus TaxID=2608891 RepID=UPI00201B3D40|nr:MULTISPECIES: hypothetical protein [unclassified Enterococcus]